MESRYVYTLVWKRSVHAVLAAFTDWKDSPRSGEIKLYESMTAMIGKSPSTDDTYQHLHITLPAHIMLHQSADTRSNMLKTIISDNHSTTKMAHVSTVYRLFLSGQLYDTSSYSLALDWFYHLSHHLYYHPDMYHTDLFECYLHMKVTQVSYREIMSLYSGMLATLLQNVRCDMTLERIIAIAEWNSQIEPTRYEQSRMIARKHKAEGITELEAHKLCAQLNIKELVRHTAHRYTTPQDIPTGVILYQSPAWKTTQAKADQSATSAPPSSAAVHGLSSHLSHPAASPLRVSFLSFVCEVLPHVVRLEYEFFNNGIFHH